MTRVDIKDLVERAGVGNIIAEIKRTNGDTLDMN